MLTGIQFVPHLVYLPARSPGRNCGGGISTDKGSAVRDGLEYEAAQNPNRAFTYVHSWRKRAVVDLVRRCAPSRIVDLGCGTASILRYLGNMGFDGEYVGYDLNPKYLELARERAGQVGFKTRFMEAPIQEPHDSDSEVSRDATLVISLETFEHIGFENWHPTLSRIDRLAEHGLISVPNERGLPVICKNLAYLALIRRPRSSYTVGSTLNSALGRFHRCGPDRGDHHGFDWIALRYACSQYFRVDLVQTLPSWLAPNVFLELSSLKA